MPPAWPIEWPHGSAEVVATAAMLRRVTFRLPSGRSFRPFATARWPGTAAAPAGPGHMRWLGQEFVCLPFGVGGSARDVASGWDTPLIHALNTPPHGPSADADWMLVEHGSGRIRLGLDYPAGHLIRRVERTIAADPHAAALDLELVVEARRAGMIAAGLHPILSLAEPAGSLRIEARFAFGLTYPAAVPGGAMLSAIGRRFDSLATVPAADGGTVDLARLPKDEPVEDVVQLCGVAAPLTVVFEARRAGLRLDWDRRLLPSCQLWLSDRALQDSPWDGGYRGLGVEPIASAFDFADTVSTSPNPIAAEGIATALRLDPERPLSIRYRLEAFEA